MNIPALRLIALEITRTCSLACKHCRGDSRDESYPDEMSFDEISAILDNAASFSRPIIIITGGEGTMNTCNGVCIRNGIMGLTIEPFGQLRFTPEGVADALRAMKNLMKFWGMVPGRLDLPGPARRG